MMKNLTKILILAMLIASAMMFTACDTNEPAFNVEGMNSLRATVLEAPEGATGAFLFEPFEEYYEKTGSPLVASAQVDNVFFAPADQDEGGRVSRASGIDLIPGTTITVYYYDLLLSSPVQFGGVIIAIDRN